MKKVVILGGYGNFGKRIVEGLMDLDDVTLFIAGRNKEKADRLKTHLNKQSKASLKAMHIDIHASNFAEKLISLSPDMVIHTSGPFQGQQPHVPQACLDAGAHYIDLSDDRHFVSGIRQLNQVAIDKGLLLVSGASSVPGLSSAVIEHYEHQFQQINSIDIAIAPGNKAERGEATIRGILSYIGRPLKVYNSGNWRTLYGWMSPRRLDFGGIVGKRWLANVDVPDLELFPEHYKVKNSVTFQAGLELSLLHWIMVSMAFFTKIGLVKNWASLTKPIMKISNLFSPFGTDIGGMNVVITGSSKNSANKQITWTLYAPQGNGPYIPTISTVIIARKILSGTLLDKGAKPCIGLYSMDDFADYCAKYNLSSKELIIG